MSTPDMTVTLAGHHGNNEYVQINILVGVPPTANAAAYFGWAKRLFEVMRDHLPQGVYYRVLRYMLEHETGRSGSPLDTPYIAHAFDQVNTYIHSDAGRKARHLPVEQVL